MILSKLWTSWTEEGLKKVVKTSLYVDEDEIVRLGVGDETYGSILSMCEYINSMGINCAIVYHRDTIVCSLFPIKQEPHPFNDKEFYYDKIFNLGGQNEKEA